MGAGALKYCQDTTQRRMPRSGPFAVAVDATCIPTDLLPQLAQYAVGGTETAVDSGGRTEVVLTGFEVNFKASLWNGSAGVRAPVYGGSAIVFLCVLGV